MLLQIRELLANEGAIKYLKNTSWLLFEKLLRIFVGLFVNVWMIRYLQPEQFGLLSYAISFAGLFTIVASLGLDEILVKYLVTDASRRDVLLGTAFTLKLVASLLILIVLIIITLTIPGDGETDLLILIIGLGAVFQSLNVIDFYFQSRVHSRYTVYANIFALGLSSLIKIALILTQASVAAFAWATTLEYLFLSLGLILFYLNNNLSLKKWSFNREASILILTNSWPIILSGLAITVYMKIDQIMIKEMINPEAVGQFAAAVKISEAWYFVPVVISSSLFPAILNAHQVSEELFLSRLQNLYDLMAWISIAIALIMTVFSNRIINFLYGSAYDQAGAVLSLHIWAGVFVFLGTASGKWFVSRNLQTLSFYRAIWGVITNLILNFLLIPRYGIKGAAIATLASQALSAYFSDCFNNLTKQQFVMKTKSLFLVTLFQRIKGG